MECYLWYYLPPSTYVLQPPLLWNVFVNVFRGTSFTYKYNIKEATSHAIFFDIGSKTKNFNPTLLSLLFIDNLIAIVVGKLGVVPMIPCDLPLIFNAPDEYLKPGFQ